MMTAGQPTWVPQAPKFGRKDHQDHVYASNFLVISVELFFWGRVVWRGRGVEGTRACLVFSVLSECLYHTRTYLQQ